VFFFQAEDGIRDKLVTGVQTCALPICAPPRACSSPTPWAAQGVGDEHARGGARRLADQLYQLGVDAELGDRERAELHFERDQTRSEERRVGKESSAERSTDEEREYERA